MYFLVNAYAPKPLDVATANLVSLYFVRTFCVALTPR